MSTREFDIVAAKSDGVSWRIFEMECCEKYFGQLDEGRPQGVTPNTIRDCKAKYIYWKLHTESTPEWLWERCCKTADNLSNVKYINDPRGWLNCHAKEKAFEVWQKAGIPCPKWFEFKNETEFFKNKHFDYPMLVRLNNSTSGWFSYLCRNDQQVREAIPKVLAKFNYQHDGIPNYGVGRKMIAVQFIPTTRPEKVNLSFRIIVAGNRVVVGYARLGSPSDWITITKKFEPWMQELFIKYQKICQKFCEDNEEMIVKSVRCLGLNFQGIDVILDQKNNPFFIEVQPGFSVGYAHRGNWKPPFYNPSKPPELRNFLLKNLERLKQETPLYTNFWLDKYKMFDKAFKSLKEQLDGTGNYTAE